jgi:hypothetical protein
MTEPPLFDRRVDPRLPAKGVTAQIGDQAYAMADFSIGGARILGFTGNLGDGLAIVLIDGTERVAAPAIVRGTDPGFTSVEFTEPTYALMSCVARHEGNGEHP